MTEKYYDTEAYLKQFTPEQWLEAMVELYQEADVTNVPIEMLKTGFALAQADGWRMVAPFWMRGFETGDIKPLEAFRNEPTEAQPEGGEGDD